MVALAVALIAYTLLTFHLQYQSGYRNGYCEGSGGTLVYDMCVVKP